MKLFMWLCLVGLISTQSTQKYHQCVNRCKQHYWDYLHCGPVQLNPKYSICTSQVEIQRNECIYSCSFQ